jgi:hypothetical protein
MRNRPILRDGRRCRCGALTEDGLSRCTKCRNRSRWYRRKAWKQHGSPYNELHMTDSIQREGGD